MDDLNLDILKKLGSKTKELRKEVSKIPKSGLKISEIINFIESSIFKEGYLPAFPCTVCVNDVAAHYTIFDEDYILQKGDVIKIDFGLSYQGYITDNAITIEVDNNKYEKLLRANLEGLNEVMKKVEIGTEMTELGNIVNSVAKKYGFNTIHNLCGHQVARNNLHCGLSVPNYPNSDTRKVENNMSLAIEPFFTIGEPKIKPVGNSNILHLNSTKPIRDPIAKKILDYIKKHYPKLPFSKRWLIKEVIEKIDSNSERAKEAFDIRRVKYGVSKLIKNGNLYEYDALGTIDSKIVSQFEDLVAFIDSKKYIITRL